MKYICVYCGSSAGTEPGHLRAAKALGEYLGDQQIGLVYGGARVGMMGAVADGVLSRGGEVIGVIPHSLAIHEVQHEGLTELIQVDTMHERKAIMVDRADGFVALPGGFGTLDELFETLTWAQLGIHQKPCALLNQGGYFDLLLQFLEHAVDSGFVKADHRDMLIVATDPPTLLRRLADYVAPGVSKLASP